MMYPFTQEEYHIAKQSLTQGKAIGEDDITAETLKRCNFDEIILDFCNEAHMKYFKPDQSSVLNIVPIPKSGDMSYAGNYRGISLISIIAKIYIIMTFNKIRPLIDPHMRVNQCGFCLNKTTVAQDLSLRRIIEGARKKNLPAVLSFIKYLKDQIFQGNSRNASSWQL